MKKKIQTRNICNVNSLLCADCSVNGKLMCTFNIKDTIYFILPVIGVWTTLIMGIIYAFIVGKIYIPFLIIFSVGYVGYVIFFLQVWENKILCSHCPYYAFEDERHVKCYANFGIYKLWKYNPAPMTTSEKIQFLIGIAFFVGIPLILFLIIGFYLFIGISLTLALVWVISMHFLSCSKCPNFSCPLNNVSKEVVNEYLKRNSVMRKAWEGQGYIIE